VGYHEQRDSSTCFSNESDIWWCLQVSPVSLLFRLTALLRNSTCVTWPSPAWSICAFLSRRYWALTARSKFFFIFGGAPQAHEALLCKGVQETRKQGASSDRRVVRYARGLAAEKRPKLPGQFRPLELRAVRRHGGVTSPLFLRRAWKPEPFSHERGLLRPVRAVIRC